MKNHRSTISHRAVWSTFYDGWTHFLGFKISTVIHCHYNAWKSQDFFKYNSDCIRLCIYNLDDLRIVSPVSSWLRSNSDRNGSAATSPPPLAETPMNRESGIIPGAIAAAVFIGFLLALYAVLWKCMVTQPKRRKKRVSLKSREQVSYMLTSGRDVTDVRTD